MDKTEVTGNDSVEVGTAEMKIEIDKKECEEGNKLGEEAIATDAFIAGLMRKNYGNLGCLLEELDLVEVGEHALSSDSDNTGSNMDSDNSWEGDSDSNSDRGSEHESNSDGDSEHEGHSTGDSECQSIIDSDGNENNVNNSDSDNENDDNDDNDDDKEDEDLHEITDGNDSNKNSHNDDKDGKPNDTNRTENAGHQVEEVAILSQPANSSPSAGEDKVIKNNPS